MSASPDVFAHLTHLLMNLAGGKLCAVLEVGLTHAAASIHTSLHPSVHPTALFLTLLLFRLSQGGYNLTSLPQSVCQTVQTLLGDPAPPSAGLAGPCRRSPLLHIHIVPPSILPLLRGLKLMIVFSSVSQRSGVSSLCPISSPALLVLPQSSW